MRKNLKTKHEKHIHVCFECQQDKKFQPYLPKRICLRRGVMSKPYGLFEDGIFYTMPIIECEKDIPKYCEYYLEHLMIEQGNEEDEILALEEMRLRLALGKIKIKI
jgi:hypothetical protein